MLDGLQLMMGGGKSASMVKNNDRRDGNRGEFSAVSETFVENNTFLKRFLSRYFSEQQDVEDVAHEAYLRAYIAEQHKDIDHPKAYLFSAAKNIALTKLTKKSRQITDYIEEASVAEVTGSIPAADEEAEAEELLGLYCEAVAALPEKCRHVFLLRKVHGLARKEIAERLSLSIASIDKYLSKGILECRAFVREQEGTTADSSSISVAPADYCKVKK